MNYYTSDAKRGYLSSLVSARRLGLTELAEKLRVEANAHAGGNSSDEDEAS